MEEVKPGSKTATSKRRYEAPAVEETAEFETLALACGKTPSDLSCGYAAGGLQFS